MFTSLRLQQFRSYKDGLFDLDPGVTIIVGPNGSGKTSLLEALLYAASGTSYKAADVDVLQYGTSWSRIDAALAGGDERTVKLQLVPIDQKVKKSFILNGADRMRLSPQQKIPTVLFEPQDMNILTGEPSARRDFLDAILSVCVPAYDTLLKNYRRALFQRNTLLKRPASPKEELFVWDLRLSEIGGFIHTARDTLLSQFAADIQATYQKISNKQDEITISYISDKTAADYTESMLARLHANYEKDIVRGFTSIGPHRDDFALTIRGLDAKIAGSRGEIRSMLLSLKLLQLQGVEHATNKRPVILLDDVFSELDGARRQALALALKDYQTFITTTDADLVVDHFSDKAHIIAL